MNYIILIILVILTGLPHILNIMQQPFTGLLKVSTLLLYITITALIIGSKIRDKKNRKSKSNQIKGNFLANISHELRTPLNGILGMNNLLLCSKLNDEQNEYAKTIRSCSESLLTTINDILDYSKIESGKLEIETIQFDLRKLITDFYNMNNLSATMKGLDFSTYIDAEATNYFSGDPGRIRQILSNLFNNAVKFTNTGQIELICKVISDDENYSKLMFIVKDTGIGIKKNKVQELFKEFTQGDSSASREFGGTGLGLAISKQLVSLLDGEIGVKSQPGIGSEFWFSFNLKKGTSLLQPKRRVDVKTSKCLIINKGTIKKSSITNILSENSIPYSLIDTYKEAINMIGDYNFLIFDLAIDPLENINLDDYIIHIKENSSINLLALTSEGNRGDGELCRSLNIDGYFVEPFIKETILEALSIILGKGTEKCELTTIHTLKENQRSKIKILLVDDNNINLIIAEKLLLKMGFHTGKAIDGKAAIEELKNNNYNLVFMDIQMPIMNGLQATDAIRKEAAGYHNKDIPIVALTANYTVEDKKDCIKVGMNEFLTKPYKPILMEEAINKYVKWNKL